MATMASNKVVPMNESMSTVTAESSILTASAASRNSLSSRGRGSPSTYESKKIGLTNFSMPEIDQKASLKHRISTLEDAFELQVQSNTTTDTHLTSLQSTTNTLDVKINDEVTELRNKLEDDMAWIIKEFTHKFDLQAAENSRLENHINSLKKENKDLLEKLNKAEDRIKILEEELLA